MIGGIVIGLLLILSTACFYRQSRLDRKRKRPLSPSYDETPWGEIIELPHSARVAKGVQRNHV